MQKRMRYFFLLVILSGSLAGGPAVADIAGELPVPVADLAQAGLAQETAASFLASLQQAGFNQRQTEQAAALLRAAIQAGLPIAEITGKAAEGRAKQASPDAILAAMRQVSDRQQFAWQQAARISTDAGMLGRTGAAVAAGLAAGIAEQDMVGFIEILLAQRPAHDKASMQQLTLESCHLLRDMARQSVPSKQAVQAVSVAIADRQLTAVRELHDDFTRAIQKLPATAVVQHYLEMRGQREQQAARENSQQQQNGGHGGGHGGGSGNSGSGSGSGGGNGGGGGGGR